MHVPPCFQACVYRNKQFDLNLKRGITEKLGACSLRKYIDHKSGILISVRATGISAENIIPNSSEILSLLVCLLWNT